MKKKLAVILMSSILAVSSLVGCGSSSASESGTENANTGAAEANTSSDAKTITVWAWDDNFNVAVMKKAAEVYKKTNPDANINVDVVSLSKEDVYVKLQTALAGYCLIRRLCVRKILKYLPRFLC